jgi:hypothetical protein
VHLQQESSLPLTRQINYAKQLQRKRQGRRMEGKKRYKEREAQRLSKSKGETHLI